MGRMNKKNTRLIGKIDNYLAEKKNVCYFCMQNPIKLITDES